jgi:hypothetical protein
MRLSLSFVNPRDLLSLFYVSGTSQKSGDMKVTSCFLTVSCWVRWPLAMSGQGIRRDGDKHEELSKAKGASWSRDAEANEWDW